MVDNDTSFEFTKEPYSTQNILNENTIRKPWHDYNSRNNDTEKVQIPKVYSPYGFHYILDAPTSSSVRREDDKVTYVDGTKSTLEHSCSPRSPGRITPGQENRIG